MPSDPEITDGDRPVSNIDDSEEMISNDSFSGEGAEIDEVEDDGFEAVEGYEPPAPLTPAGGNEFAPEAVGGALSLAEETTQLRDIGEASFGPAEAVAESVIGTDDRVRITNTGSYPWRAHASLRITAADDSLWIGTGWFIGPNLLVTAGHVVYIKNSGVPGRDGWVKRMVVMPGRDGANLPYGSVNGSRFWTVTGWANNGNPEYDYGAIALNQPLGSTTGWFGFGNWSNLNNVGGNVSGYPGDKPTGTQWYAGRRIDSVTSRKVFYDIDTAGGQSGSAVYRFVNGGRYGIAIHAYGGTRVNSGTRINGQVFKNLKAWKQASEA